MWPPSSQDLNHMDFSAKAILERVFLLQKQQKCSYPKKSLKKGTVEVHNVVVIVNSWSMTLDVLLLTQVSMYMAEEHLNCTV